LSSHASLKYAVCTCLLLRHPAGPVGVMVQHEVSASDDHTHFGRCAVLLLPQPAGTLHEDHVRRALEQDVACGGVGDDLVEVGARDVVVQRDDGARKLVGEHLAVVVICPPLLALLGAEPGKEVPLSEADVLVAPPRVHVPVDARAQASSPSGTLPVQPIPQRRPGRRQDQVAPLADQPQHHEPEHQHCYDDRNPQHHYLPHTTVRTCIGRPSDANAWIDGSVDRVILPPSRRPAVPSPP
jgi:hypothetical protein